MIDIRSVVKKTIVLTFTCLSLCLGRGWAQSDTTLSAKNLSLAHRLTDRGLYDESLALLDDADALDPVRTAVWPYEKAVVYSLKEDYPEAIKLLRRAARFRDASDSVYRLLGDCYLQEGDSDMAFETYIIGLQKFPDSGPLYYGRGLVYFAWIEFDLALDSFLEGIARDPAHASNWYGAGAIYLDSGDKAFGMVDGETAVCLDPDSELSGVMCRALWATYLENISFTRDSVVGVSFSSGTVSASGGSAAPFPEVYEEILSKALAGERELDLPSLVGIRRRFIENWFSAGLNETYPCLLFDLHLALIEARHFEAYNYRLFSREDPAAFASWDLGNPGSLEAFREWFNQNPMVGR